MLELELFREDGRLKVPDDTGLLDTYIERAKDVGADAQDLSELIACRKVVTRQQDAAAKALEDLDAAEEISADEAVSVEGGGVSTLVSAQNHDEGSGNASIVAPVGSPALARIGTADFRRQGSMQLEEEILQNCQLARRVTQHQHQMPPKNYVGSLPIIYQIPVYLLVRPRYGRDRSDAPTRP